VACFCKQDARSTFIQKGGDMIVKDNRSKLRLWAIISILFLCSVLFFKLIRSFISPIVIALSFTSLMYPLYQNLLKRFKKKKNLASFTTCLVLIIIIFIPLIILLMILAHQAQIVYTQITPFIQNISEISEQEIISRLKQYEIFDTIELYSFDWSGILIEAGNKLLQLMTYLFNRYSSSFILFFVDLFITFFCMFYFFRDGDKLLIELQSLSPLNKEHDRKLFDHFNRISRATVKGTLIIGLLQGSLGALTLMLFGVNTWLLWGFIMLICSIIPMIGAWVVLVPAGIIQILFGNTWSGILIILISTLVISNVDNLIRPYLVGKDAKMHDLMIFFSTIGGISLFGIMGFIIGPVIASLFLALLQIYKDEFQESLKK
ncbi:MAG TPA: AI-2E family transporter, partial [Candidatus Cloacimonadota bacterium]|nr:AI-2E family transporter [Candidatus Cloacimonadota bacterium]